MLVIALLLYTYKEDATTHFFTKIYISLYFSKGPDFCVAERQGDEGLETQPGRDCYIDLF